MNCEAQKQLPRSQSAKRYPLFFHSCQTQTCPPNQLSLSRIQTQPLPPLPCPSTSTPSLHLSSDTLNLMSSLGVSCCPMRPSSSRAQSHSTQPVIRRCLSFLLLPFLFLLRRKKPSSNIFRRCSLCGTEPSSSASSQPSPPSPRPRSSLLLFLSRLTSPLRRLHSWLAFKTRSFCHRLTSMLRRSRFHSSQRATGSQPDPRPGPSLPSSSTPSCPILIFRPQSPGHSSAVLTPAISDSDILDLLRSSPPQPPPQRPTSPRSPMRSTHVPRRSAQDALVPPEQRRLTRPSCSSHNQRSVSNMKP